MDNVIETIIEDIVNEEELRSSYLELIVETQEIIEKAKETGYLDLNYKPELTSIELYEDIITKLQRYNDIKPLWVAIYIDRLRRAPAVQATNICFI